MASSLIKVGTINNLAPGASTTANWNNATPSSAVWYIQAIPQEGSFIGPTSSNENVQVEVTRVWRRLNRTLGTSDLQFFKFEHEIWYTIKNIGTKEVDVEVFASVIS